MSEIVYLSRKKSGNYIVSKYTRINWNLIATCTSPKSLFDSVKSLPENSVIIRAEYSQSQLKCYPDRFTKEYALMAFGISKTKENLENYFK